MPQQLGAGTAWNAASGGRASGPSNLRTSATTASSRPGGRSVVFASGYAALNARHVAVWAAATLSLNRASCLSASPVTAMTRSAICWVVGYGGRTDAPAVVVGSDVEVVDVREWLVRPGASNQSGSAAGDQRGSPSGSRVCSPAYRVAALPLLWSTRAGRPRAFTASATACRSMRVGRRPVLNASRSCASSSSSICSDRCRCRSCLMRDMAHCCSSVGGVVWLARWPHPRRDDVQAPAGAGCRVSCRAPPVVSGWCAARRTPCLRHAPQGRPGAVWRAANRNQESVVLRARCRRRSSVRRSGRDTPPRRSRRMATSPSTVRSCCSCASACAYRSGKTFCRCSQCL
jgi:hypothetical protein